MPLSPQRRRRRRPLYAAAGNHALANADQNLTGVDTRLTKVDKGCQKLTPSTPAPTPNPSKTQQNHNRHHHPDTPSVNLRCQPHQHTPNNPEQIRTNLNKPEHRQAPRPDREAARITQKHPEKKETRTPPPPTRNLPPQNHHSPTLRHPCAPLPSFLRRQEPHPPPSFLRPPIVIPAQAGTHTHHITHPSLPQFIPPPFQGGG